ncbi:UDP-glucose 4-epimerase GalE [Dactylosporangium aurantiacum]|uniref:UDP-glucose 4-epimerase n=1 Tax=Dactylosporangium aurantiacum TaxID=35754 RepID=A0A9Q9IPI2_9ACTN|nr:UDP-glucose 4-epimerase GalE [Dactylosporangium aurantiacum]MDG6102988.1 UDP-glucose 4-epimerase GalE [Dactylosporangium aurantiacum]UWZ57502.1 UDP-glucose 4-epimerase GalE [Dactylosporangium aurantiacum]
MTWLVTGGAGYIGAHVLRALTAAGHAVVAFDDLSSGVAARVPDGVPLVVGAVTDRRAVAAALRRHAAAGVVHLAARKSPLESVRRPAWYHRENVGGTQSVLAAMAATGVRRLVFASSAAVYGQVTAAAVDEGAPTRPINPYGASKLACERRIAEAGVAWVALRFFNVAGSGDPRLGDREATNLVPIAVAAARAGRPLAVTGTDFDTPDGTGVRDYVHVEDVADAHAAAVAHLCRTPVAGAVYNVGTGRGHSVLDVVRGVEAVAGCPIERTLHPRRPGDPASVVADAGRIQRELGWRASRGLTEMVTSAWHCWSPRLTADAAP